jgi:hypothetical protein
MKVSVYPNPNAGIFTLKSDFNNVEKIQIIDILGRVQYEQNLQTKELKYGKNFIINNLPSGIYFVKLLSGNLTKSLKISIQ